VSGQVRSRSGQGKIKDIVKLKSKSYQISSRQGYIEVRSGQVKFGQVSSGKSQVRSSQSQVRSGEVRSGTLASGYGRSDHDNVRAGHVSSR